jgi:hypothetical protein
MSQHLFNSLFLLWIFALVEHFFAPSILNVEVEHCFLR